MAYRSDVRIRLTKKDYEKLIKELNEQFAEDKDTWNLFEHLEVFAESKQALLDQNGNEVKEVNCVYFGWDYIKWYIGYKEVKFITEFLGNTDNYAFTIIGEEYGDVEVIAKNMYEIPTRTCFIDQDE